MLVQNPIENILIWAAIFYFLPSFVALGKGRFASVFALNFFLGWTLVGWVMALVWALAPSQSRGPLVSKFQYTASGDASASDRVVTTIMRDPSIAWKPWQALRKGQAVLIKYAADERWSVSSEEGVLGYLDEEVAKIVSFRSDAIGKPKAKVIRIDTNIGDGIAADFEIVFDS